MTLFDLRGAKSHEWIFCDTIKIDGLTKSPSSRMYAKRSTKGWNGVGHTKITFLILPPP